MKEFIRKNIDKFFILEKPGEKLRKNERANT